MIDWTKLEPEVVSSLPTASVTHRGRLVYLNGAAGAADGMYICLKSASDTYSWIMGAAGGS